MILQITIEYILISVKKSVPVNNCCDVGDTVG